MKIKNLFFIGMAILILIFMLLLLIRMTNPNHICKTFQDDVLWTSGYDIDKPSFSYYSWEPANCPGTDCFIKKISIYTRAAYFGDEKGEACLQISNSHETDCKNPLKARYSNYVFYAEPINTNGELIFSWDCGKQKKNNLCSLSRSDGYNSTCYSVKALTDRLTLLDALKIKYDLCWTGESKENKGITYFLVYTGLTISIIFLIFLFLRIKR